MMKHENKPQNSHMLDHKNILFDNNDVKYIKIYKC